MSRVDGAHAVITGASRGLGKSLAYEFARLGARATLVARDAASLEAVAHEIGAAAVVADLSTKPGCDGLVAEIQERSGPIDILVNNAGAVHAESFVRQGADELQRAIQLNLLAPMELTRQALSPMLARGQGHIVNIGSMAALGVFPGLVSYATAKAGLAHFSAGLRVDLHGTGIVTTHVDLGPVPTDALATARSYPPADASYRRAFRMHLLTEVSVLLAARVVAEAVQRDRRTVHIPRRGAVLGHLVELPRRAVEVVALGPRRVLAARGSGTRGP